MSDTKLCPYCAEEIRSAALKCRYCGSYLAARLTRFEWTRSPDSRMIAGVCGGLAERFDVSVTVVRLAFVLAALMSFGWPVILYAVLWAIMPVEERRSLDEFTALEEPLPPPERSDYL